MWRPKLNDRSGPLYRQIVDALREDVSSARIAEGTRLPPQRELAKELGVTVGTVARAYRQAQAEGIVVGGVGSGTFVQAFAQESARTAKRAEASDSSEIIDLTQNSILRTQHRPALTALITALTEKNDFIRSISSAPHVGRAEHRAIAAGWIADKTALEPSPGGVILCNGGQHALDIALRTITRPDDGVMVEDLTYPGLRAAAVALGLRLLPIETDAEGLIPAAFDRAAKTQGARVLFTVPTMHTATAVTQSEARRREIADLARKHDVHIIEDGVFDPLQVVRGKPIASMTPERTLYISSISKVVSSALQCGILVLPPALQPRAADLMRATCWSASPLAISLAMAAIADGTAHELLLQNRAEAERRQKLARAILQGVCRIGPNRQSYHLWIGLDSPRAATEFLSGSRAANVAVVPAEAFWVASDTPAPLAFRLSLMGPETAETMSLAIEKLLLVLQGRYSSVPSVV